VEPAMTKAAVDVGKIRRGLNLTQAAFAQRFGIPIGTIRDWEQGRKMPEATTRTLLLVIASDPKAVDRALKR
jgi:putative transcriptional regulator